MGDTFIYARTSTTEQNVDQQVEFLKSKYGDTLTVFSDQCSGKNLHRPAFEQMRSNAKESDTIIVQDLSRIGRNTTEVLRFIEDMTKKKVSIIVDDLGRVDVTSATGKMVVTTLAAVATMQREQILEKQAIGIDRAKAEGKFKGKQQSQATINACEKAIKLMNENKLSKTDAAKVTGISHMTLYRYIKQAEAG